MWRHIETAEAVETEAKLRVDLDLVARLWRLRVARKVGIVLVDCGRVYLCESEFDPWGSRRRLSPEALRELVEAAEGAGSPARKPVAMECGEQSGRAAGRGRA
jgi:hypothetical protein